MDPHVEHPPLESVGDDRVPVVGDRQDHGSRERGRRASARAPAAPPRGRRAGGTPAGTPARAGSSSARGAGWRRRPSASPAAFRAPGGGRRRSPREPSGTRSEPPFSALLWRLRRCGPGRVKEVDFSASFREVNARGPPPPAAPICMRLARISARNDSRLTEPRSRGQGRYGPPSVRRATRATSDRARSGGASGPGGGLPCRSRDRRPSPSGGRPRNALPGEMRCEHRQVGLVTDQHHALLPPGEQSSDERHGVAARRELATDLDRCGPSPSPCSRGDDVRPQSRRSALRAHERAREDQVAAPRPPRGAARATSRTRSRPER